MSGPGFGLVIGAQTKAAGYVVDFENELADIADMLEADITGQLSQVNGTYVSILGEALTAWGGSRLSARWGPGSLCAGADLCR